MTMLRHLFLAAAGSAFLLLAGPPRTALSQAPSSSAPQSSETAVQSAPQQPAAGQVALPESAPGEGSVYTIKQADTLWDISGQFLKDPFLWPLIWKVNPSIVDPDLIFPGNTLRIPNLAPVERAMQAPQETAPAVETARTEPVAPAPPPAAPVRPKAEDGIFRGKKLAVEKPAEEEAQSGSRLILPEEASPPLIDKYSMLNAGFVDRGAESPDVVEGGIEPKSIYSYDDIIMLKMHSADTVNVGDRMLVYEPYKKVRHPETGKDFGKLVKVLGIVLITSKEPNGLVSARVTISFDAIEKGNHVTPYIEPTLFYPTEAVQPKNINGFILEVRDAKALNAQRDIVYLDKGSVDGVAPGDSFLVYLEPKRKGYPNKIIGEVQVFLVRERTATALVKKSTDAMAKGDRIMFKN